MLAALQTGRPKQDETLIGYIHRIWRLGKRALIGDRLIIEHIVEGLPGDAYQKAALYACRRLDELKIALATYETVRRVAGRTSARTTRGGDGTSQVESGAKHTKGGKCYNCGVSGHIGRDCPDKGGGPRCYVCGQTGHMSRSCPRQTAEGSSPGNRSRCSDENQEAAIRQ